MKYTAAVAALAATASAAVLPRQDYSTVFKVTNFSAACIAHSVQCSYSFDVYQPGTMETAPGVHCSAMLVSDGLGTLPPVTDGTCEQSSRTWTVTKGEDGALTLALSQQVTPISYTVGDHVLAADEIVFEQTGASRQQVYTGANEFDLKRVE